MMYAGTLLARRKAIFYGKIDEAQKLQLVQTVHLRSLDLVYLPRHRLLQRARHCDDLQLIPFE
jgi:hypothetical protein